MPVPTNAIYLYFIFFFTLRTVELTIYLPTTTYLQINRSFDNLPIDNATHKSTKDQNLSLQVILWDKKSMNAIFVRIHSSYDGAVSGSIFLTDRRGKESKEGKMCTKETKK